MSDFEKLIVRVKLELIAGLRTDEAHHKQWYLEQALRLLTDDADVEEALKAGLFESGIAP